MKPLSEALNRQIVSLAPDFIVVDDAPNNYKDLLRHGIDNQGRVRIKGGSSDKTIYGNEYVNHCFRAWHDSLHIKHEKSFSLKGELFIADRHRELITGDLEKRLIYADTAGQIEHYYRTKSFVDNQYNFVLDYYIRIDKRKRSRRSKSIYNHNQRRQVFSILSINHRQGRYQNRENFS